MADHIPLPAKQYSVIYADPPWHIPREGTRKVPTGLQNSITQP